MKYKPTVVPLAMALAKSEDLRWFAIPAFIWELGQVSKKGDDYWSCGKCGSPIRFHGGMTPKVCTNCGNEIDWVGIKTRIIKVCPTCGKEGSIYDQFCDLHVPAVRLVNKEVPL